MQLQAPSVEEVTLLHALMRHVSQPEDPSLAAQGGIDTAGSDKSGNEVQVRTCAEDSIHRDKKALLAHFRSMSKTYLSHCCLMHSQDRNTNHRIFGGHLLRLAFEVTHSKACDHEHRKPGLRKIDTRC